MPTNTPIAAATIKSIRRSLALFLLLVTLSAGCAPRCTTSPVTVTFADGSQTEWLITVCRPLF